MAQDKGMLSMMDEKRVFPPPKEFSEKAYIKSWDEYKKIYDRSITDPEGFWAEKAEQLDWFKKWDKVMDWEFDTPTIKWFLGAKLNVSYNCLDRHLGTERENKVAILWEGNEPSEIKKYTYKELHAEVSRFANVLKDLGVKKGDRVAIYLPMIPELAISLLACARIGAIHSVVFGGFSAEALADRMNDFGATVLVTQDEGWRAGKRIPLKANADAALEFLDLPGIPVLAVDLVRIADAVGPETGRLALHEGRPFSLTRPLHGGRHRARHGRQRRPGRHGGRARGAAHPASLPG